MFTLDDVNPNLLSFIDELMPPASTAPAAAAAAAASSASVLVPLCGRSVDMAWLAEQGHTVVGVDAIADPLRRFANEFGGGLEPIGEAGGMTSFQCRALPRVTLLHGDVFRTLDAVPELRTRCRAVYDRAALTSIGEAHRARYLRLLGDALVPGGRLLCEFLSCNLDLEGAADEAAVLAGLATAGLVRTRVLRREDVRAAYPGFSPPGLLRLDEIVVVAEKPGRAERVPPSPRKGGVTSVHVASSSGAGRRLV